MKTVWQTQGELLLMKLEPISLKDTCRDVCGNAWWSQSQVTPVVKPLRLLLPSPTGTGSWKLGAHRQCGKGSVSEKSDTAQKNVTCKLYKRHVTVKCGNAINSKTFKDFAWILYNVCRLHIRVFFMYTIQFLNLVQYFTPFRVHVQNKYCAIHSCILQHISVRRQVHGDVTQTHYRFESGWDKAVFAL